jgi:hypothetical protein
MRRTRLCSIFANEPARKRTFELGPTADRTSQSQTPLLTTATLCARDWLGCPDVVAIPALSGRWPLPEGCCARARALAEGVRVTV